MCTLVIGQDVLGPGTVVIAANRDEDPQRPSEGPGVLSESPWVVGGRDRVAGGTWLGLRDGEAMIAMLNRRPGGGPRDTAGFRSRGLLALDVAAVPRDAHGEGPDPDAAPADPLARAALHRAWSSVAAHRYAPFTLIFASARASWWMAWDGEGTPRTAPIVPGWHAVTHREVDDSEEPRAAHLVRRLADFRPAGFEQAAAVLGGLLRSHGEDSGPPVCLHDGPVVTVSSSMVCMARGRVRYWHAEGWPCRSTFADHSELAIASSRDRRS